MAVFFSDKGKMEVVHHDKNTRQGNSKNTKCAASSRNKKKKRYRGQGR